MHRLAIEAQLRDREQSVGIDPGIRTADRIFDFLAPSNGKIRDLIRPQVCNASDIAETKTGYQVEVTQQFRRLVPRVADKPFVRALAGQHYLLSASVDAAR